LDKILNSQINVTTIKIKMDNSWFLWNIAAIIINCIYVQAGQPITGINIDQ